MSDISRITRGLRTGIDTDPTHGAVVPPIYTSSTYTFAGLGDKRPYDYSRCGNPTRDQLGRTSSARRPPVVVADHQQRGPG